VIGYKLHSWSDLSFSEPLLDQLQGISSLTLLSVGVKWLRCEADNTFPCRNEVTYACLIFTLSYKNVFKVWFLGTGTIHPPAVEIILFLSAHYLCHMPNKQHQDISETISQNSIRSHLNAT
jgi:hypothetical protein